MKQIVTLILAFTFIVCVYHYGTENRFCLRCYVENITEHATAVSDSAERLWGDNSFVTDLTDLFEGDDFSFWDIGDIIKGVWNIIKGFFQMLMNIITTLLSVVPWDASRPIGHAH